MKKQYLGDGVYVEYEYGNIVLTTEDGTKVTNIIMLESEVWYALEKYVASIE